MAKSNNGAPGIDGVTFDAIEESGPEIFLRQIRDELAANTYRPMPARKKEIPKDGGKVRVLSIPAIRDRVVQGALKRILEPILEADVQPGSYGYRPKRTAHPAVNRVAQAIVEEKTRIIDIDLRAYLDTASYCPRVAEKIRLLIHDFDTQAFAPALPHQHGLELAALYTLQYRLSRNAEFHGRLQHRQIFRRGLLDDARS